MAVSGTVGLEMMCVLALRPRVTKARVTLPQIRLLRVVKFCGRMEHVRERNTVMVKKPGAHWTILTVNVKVWLKMAGSHRDAGMKQEILELRLILRGFGDIYNKIANMGHDNIK